MEFSHSPVLLKETLAGLKVFPGGTYIDATLGGGGHAGAILQGISPGGTLIGIDRDGEALEAARQNLEGRGFAADFIPVWDNFANLQGIAAGLGFGQVDGILFDLGVSSYQLDNPDRGFTYQQDAPLDMRMDQARGATAADLVNTLPERELARIIKDYGEERWARRIAGFIGARRQAGGRIETTKELVDLIKAAVPARARREGGHPARRTFQALRIAVNEELDIITPALFQAAQLLAPGGRLAVITFHSLEDRLVKKALIRLQGGCTCPPGLPECACSGQGPLRVITRRPVTPAGDEVEKNNRARSAKLRIAEKRQVLKERMGE